MKILLIGANGFIGSHLTRSLLAAGHGVFAAVRDLADFSRKFPDTPGFQIDMRKTLRPENWLPHLQGIDAIINCAGVLQTRDDKDTWAIHHASPAALFRAAEKAGVKKVVQISAISADVAAGTPYALSKLASDDDLRVRNLDWTILRPSLVIAENAYGGTQALRNFATFPLFMPLPGNGDQVFQAVTMPDLCALTLQALTDSALRRQTIDVVGPEVLTVKEIMEKFRAWLGKKPAPTLEFPMATLFLLSKLANFIGAGPFRETALIHMNYGNAGSKGAEKKLEGFLGRNLQTLDEFFKANPPVFTGR